MTYPRDDYEEEGYEGDFSCAFCGGKGWYNSDGWPVHCEHCDSSCNELCPACLVNMPDTEDIEAGAQS